MKRHRTVEPLDSRRIRKISGSFSWIDHRFIRWTEELSRNEILLYLWLVLVGDRNGVSFYSNEKTAARLKITVSDIDNARVGLCDRDLILYQAGITQVMPLPDPLREEAPPRAEGSSDARQRTGNPRPISQRRFRTFIPSDGEPAWDLSKQIVQDIRRKLERT